MVVITSDCDQMWILFNEEEIVIMNILEEVSVEDSYNFCGA